MQVLQPGPGKTSLQGTPCVHFFCSTCDTIVCLQVALEGHASLQHVWLAQCANSIIYREYDVTHAINNTAALPIRQQLRLVVRSSPRHTRKQPCMLYSTALPPVRTPAAVKQRQQLTAWCQRIGGCRSCLQCTYTHSLTRYCLGAITPFSSSVRKLLVQKNSSCSMLS